MVLFTLFYIKLKQTKLSSGARDETPALRLPVSMLTFTMLTLLLCGDSCLVVFDNLF